MNGDPTVHGEANAPESAAEMVPAEMVPGPRLAPGLIAMTGYRVPGRPGPPHRGLPSSTLTFIVSRDDGVTAAPASGDLVDRVPTPVILGGLHVRASRVCQSHEQAGVQMAVHPLAARALFGVPAAELSVSDFDGRAVLGPAGRRLHERVAESRDWPGAFRVIAEFARGALDARERTAVRSELAYAWHLLERSSGRMPVAQVARTVGLSPRHLGALFHREVGHSPKTVAGLIRFERATGAIAATVRRSGTADLAGIAAAVGYSDQAHLSRDFTRFASCPPRAWLAEEFRNIQDGGFRSGSE